MGADAATLSAPADAGGLHNPRFVQTRPGNALGRVFVCAAAQRNRRAFPLDQRAARFLLLRLLPAFCRLPDSWDNILPGAGYLQFEKSGVFFVFLGLLLRAFPFFWHSSLYLQYGFSCSPPRSERAAATPFALSLMVKKSYTFAYFSVPGHAGRQRFKKKKDALLHLQKERPHGSGSAEWRAAKMLHFCHSASRIFFSIFAQMHYSCVLIGRGFSPHRRAKMGHFCEFFVQFIQYVFQNFVTFDCIFFLENEHFHLLACWGAGCGLIRAPAPAQNGGFRMLCAP